MWSDRQGESAEPHHDVHLRREGYGAHYRWNARTDVADVTTYTFNPMRRLTQVDGPAGTNLKTVYDYYADGSLKTTDRQEMVGATPVMRRETRTYKPTGELETVTDPEGNGDAIRVRCRWDAKRW